MECKQVILIRADLKLPKGKLGAQAAHASCEAVLRSLPDKKSLVKRWREQGQKKVVLRVESQEELFRFEQLAKTAGIVAALITDAGRTVIAPGTVTALGIGPDEEERIDRLTGSLKML